MFVIATEDNETHDSLDALIMDAKHDPELRNSIIRQYRPFILSSASESAKRYLVYGHDDEISIAMMAFNEAIDSYKDDKQISFLSFARNVIKRRLIDFYRKESRRDGEILVSDFVDEEEDRVVNTWEVQYAEDKHNEEQAASDRRDEIMQFTADLKKMGISLQEIVEVSPKHEDARLRAMEIAGVIAENPMLRQYLMEKKTIPIKKIEQMVDCSAKTIERQRKYIIAVTLVLMGDYHYLSEYIKLPR